MWPKVRGRFGLGRDLGPLVPIKGSVNGAGYKDIYIPCLNNASEHRVRSRRTFFGMNWNTDCESDLIIQTSALDITDALVAEWEKIPPKYGGKPETRRVEAIKQQINASGLE